MKTKAIALASTLLCSTAASAQIAFDPSNMAWMFKVLMPAAVHLRGDRFIISQVPRLGWPWPNGVAAKGFMSVWLNPGPKPGSNDPYPSMGSIYSSLLETNKTLSGSTAIDFLLQTAANEPALYLHQILVEDISNPNTRALYTRTDGNPPSDLIAGLWQNLRFSWDTSTLTMKGCVGSTPLDLSIIQSSTPFNTVDTDHAEFIDFFVQHLIQSPAYVGAVSEYYVKFGEYHDPCDPDIQVKFENPEGHQTFLGLHGERPFGDPDFYFGDWGSESNTWGCNAALYGPRTDMIGGQPPRVPGPNADIVIGPGGWVPKWEDLAPWPRIRGTASRC